MSKIDDIEERSKSNDRKLGYSAATLAKSMAANQPAGVADAASATAIGVVAALETLQRQRR